jgi:glycosyltransferase involved in cell wall biosynthesis
MNEIKLSYVITTWNKLPYLKEVLNKLIENLEEDEEIVITDGASTDGTKEYLSELFKAGKIQQFISERDKGEAHGFNKAFLMAKGELIKIITDDDVYYYPGIKKCKDYMLTHTEVDMISFDGLSLNTTFGNFEYSENNSKGKFLKWKNNKVPFEFCGLGFMLRRSSLPLTGLFHAGFKIVDLEFSLRATSIPVNLVWYTGLCYVNIVNSDSNSVKYWERLEREREDAFAFYLKKKKLVDFSLKKKIKAPLIYIKNNIFNRKHKVNKISEVGFSEKYERSYLMLKEFNMSNKAEFIS